MKFTCEKNVLQTACSVVSRATANKSPIPALEGILVEASGKVKVTGYDLKKAIYTSFEADIIQQGSIVMPAKLFSEMIRRMPDGFVTVESDDNDNVKIKCGKNEYNFIGISTEDYPEMPNVDCLNSITIPQNTLSSMINQTIFAVSTSESRPIYTGTLFDIEADTLTLVSVDGFRLAKRCEKIEDGKMEDCSFVVPGTALSDIERICTENGDVSISVGSKHISFTIDNTVVITRKLEGEFINYKKSIPTVFKHTISIDRSSFMASIDRVSIILTEKNSSPLRVTFSDEIIKCVSVTPIGKAEDECSCEGSGNDLEVGFNDRYLMDALKASSTDKLKLCLNTSSSPFIIKDGEGTEKFVFMVLPVRLRAGD